MKSIRIRRGFILLSAITTLSAIGLLVTAAMTSFMSQNRLVANIRGAAEARHLADGMARLMILTQHRALMQGRRSGDLPVDGSIRECLGPAGSRVLMKLQDEGGKVDLNFAPEALLLLLFRGLGTPQAEEVVKSIMQFRHEDIAGNTQRGFQSVQELATLPLDPPVVRTLAQLVTVHARQPGVDLTVAPAMLREMLGANGTGPRPFEFQQPSGSMSFRLGVDVVMPDGSRFVRSTIVTYSFNPFPTFAIEEWLRGSTLTPPTPDRVVGEC